MRRGACLIFLYYGSPPYVFYFCFIFNFLGILQIRVQCSNDHPYVIIFVVSGWDSFSTGHQQGWQWPGNGLAEPSLMALEARWLVGAE